MRIDIKEEQLASNEQRIVLRTLAESVARAGCKFLEVGSWCGDSSVILGKVAKQYGGHLFCVDWWKGNVDTYLMEIAQKEDVFSYFWKRICGEGLEDVVVPIRGRSEVASEILLKHSFDMVFIDADHKYESVLKDIRQYAPLVKREGGILCGHDCEGRLSDYDREFLKSGKDVDYYETVHCGVVLAVGSIFKEYSINYNIWNVRATVNSKGWEPINLKFIEIKDKKQLPPPPLGSTKNYVMFRYGKLVYAIPRSLDKLDVTEEEVRNHPKVLSAKNLGEVEKLVDEKLSFTTLPVLMNSYNGYNLIQYKDRIYAIAQALGNIDLTQENEQNLRSYQESNSCIVADSLYDAKLLVNELICQNLEKELEDRGKRIEVFQKDILNRNETIGKLNLKVEEGDKSIERLSIEIDDRDKKIKVLQEEMYDREGRINVLRGVSTLFAPTPILLNSYKDYNLIQYKDRIYAISQALGSLDLTQEEKNFYKYKEEGSCLIGDTTSGLMHLIDQLLWKGTQKIISERENRIKALELEKETSERALKIDGLQRQVSEKDESIEKLNEELISRDKSINALQEELMGIKSIRWYRVIKKILYR